MEPAIRSPIPPRGRSSCEGMQVGSYQVVRELGRGGMGVVYLAAHRVLKSFVALKTLREEYLSNTQIRARFEQEALLGATVRSPHLVQIVDVLTFPDGRPCIVMEYCPGATLDIWSGRGPMPPERAADIIDQVC